MSTPATLPTPTTPPPAAADGLPTPASVPKGAGSVEDLDLEEDIAPNLGGEDQMQDA